MSTGSIRGATPIVINWHVAEACNFRCRYCYAHWQRATTRDLIRDRTARRELLAELFGYFAPQRSQHRPRLSPAGGKPLLFLDEICLAIQEAHDIGFDISMITNGSRMNSAVVERIAHAVDVGGERGQCLSRDVGSNRPQRLAWAAGSAETS